MRNNRPSEAGFSLLEAMVTAGLLGGLAMGGLTLFKTNLKAQKTVEKNFEITAEVETIRGILTKPINCDATMAGKSPVTGSFTAIRRDVNGTMSDVYTVGTQLPGGISVTAFQMDKTLPGLAADETQLKITFSRGKGSVKEEATRYIRISYVADGSGNVQTCYATSGGDGFWKQSTVDPNDIFYPLGKVGIGVSNPRGKLDVDGSVRLKPGSPSAGDTSAEGMAYADNGDTGLFMTNYTNSTNGDLVMYQNNSPVMAITSAQRVGIGVMNPTNRLSVGPGSTFNVNDDGDVVVTGGADARWGLYGPTGAEKMALTSSGDIVMNQAGGNVGIGSSAPVAKLEVAGQIKIGAPGTCDAANEGSLAYDSGLKAMKFCNGTSWQAIGATGTVTSHALPFSGSLQPIGCYSYCALTHAHDCNNCGWDIVPGGSCGSGKYNWSGRSNRVDAVGTATCIDF